MSNYPKPTVDGVEACRVILLGSGAGDLPASFDLPIVTEEGFSWTPERTDGGEINITLNDGMIIQRSHRWRARFEFKWELMNYLQALRLRRVLNHIAKGKQVFMQPHKDLNQVWEVVREPSAHQFNHPSSMYIGHNATEVFIGKYLRRELPMKVSYNLGGDLEPIIPF